MYLFSHGRGVNNRVPALTAVVTLFCTVLAACSSGSSGGSGDSGTTKGSIQIALIADETGADAVNGQAAFGGAKTAVAEINKAGGIDGHTIDLKAYDTQSDVTTAQAATREALGRKPAAATGFVSSDVAASLTSILASAQIPWVGSSYQAPGVNALKFWFTTNPLITEQSDGQAVGAVVSLRNLLGGSLSGKRVALEGGDAPVIHTTLDVETRMIKAGGGTVVARIVDPLSLTTWTSQAAKVAGLKPNGVIANETETAMVPIVKSLVAAGVTVPIVSADGASSDAMLKSISAQNLYVVRESVAATKGSALYNSAIAAGVSPDVIGAAAFGKEYAAVYAVSAALTKCGIPCPTASFASALPSLGPIAVPNLAMFGKLDFSHSQSGLTTAQTWTWDAAKAESVASGKPFAITGS